jgi:hypothetical protein
MTSDKVAGVSVENGDLVLLNENGGKGNRINGSYTCAAVCGDDLIAVRKSGEIVHFIIDGPRLNSSGKSFGNSQNPVSIQLNHGLNFMIQRANGQTDVFTSGQKNRTIGEAIQSSTQPSSSASSSSSQSSESSAASEPYQVPDGIMAGMAYRCERLIKDPIPGPWAKICVWLSALSSLIGGAIVFFNATKFDDPTKIAVAFGLVVINFGVCYWLRNVIAKVLVRSWFGIPIVLLGALIGQSYPEVGGWVALAGVVVWFWPVWPIAIIAVTVVGLVFVAIGKTTPTMGNNR